MPEARLAREGTPGGNPSSPHAEGRVARAALDSSRDRAAAALGVQAREVLFCSNGTEAVNLALLGAGRRLPADRSLVTWSHEHQSVLGAARQLQAEGRPVHVLPVDGQGFADPSVPEDAGLISLGMANNEVGTLQPVAEVAAQARSLGSLLHVDCCQGPRWLAPPLQYADLASFSGHKVGAGSGGMLMVRGGVQLQPLMYGGPQEWRRRAGYEDVASAAALAATLEVCAAQRTLRSAAVKPLTEQLRRILIEIGGRLTGAEPRLPNFATATFSTARGEDLILALDMAGVAASSGSVCASGSLDPSHVLLAMGLSMDEALGSLRLTLGYDTSPTDVERVFHVLHSLPLHVRG